MVEGAFSNPNADVAERTAGWLRETTRRALAERGEDAAWFSSSTASTAKKSRKKKTRTRLTELYCGNGTHTVNLARAFRAVTAVEIEPRLCAAARENFAANGVTNASVEATPAAHATKVYYQEAVPPSGRYDSHIYQLEHDHRGPP